MIFPNSSGKMSQLAATRTQPASQKYTKLPRSVAILGTMDVTWSLMAYAE